VVLIDVKVINKTALSFLNIGSSLIKGKRKMVECHDNISCLIDLFV